MTSLQTALSQLEGLLPTQPTQMQRFDLVFALIQLIPNVDKLEITKVQNRLESCIFATISQTCNKSLRGLIVSLVLLMLKHGNSSRVQEVTIEALRITKDPKSTEYTKM